MAATVAGNYGALNLNAAGAWSYVQNNDALPVQALGAGQLVQEHLTINCWDGTAAHIRVTVTGAADASLIVGTEGANRLVGTKAGDHIYALGGTDRLNGGIGNDVLSGGAGADVFVFTGQSGHDVITDFEINVAREVIDLSQISDLHGYKDLRAHHMTEVGGSTVLSFGANEITLEGVAMSRLAANDFLF